jgi:hypothetical protein
MSKIDPSRSGLPLDARYRSEPDPRVRTLLKSVRDHVEYEIAGDLEPLMATLSERPVYHFRGTPAPMALNGAAAVEVFYKQMFAAGGNQFEIVTERIVADADSVVTQGHVKQVYTGKELAAMGRRDVNGAPVADADLYLSTTLLITVWPGTADGKLIGEDIYFGEPALSNLEKIAPEDLPDGYRWRHRV